MPLCFFYLPGKLIGMLALSRGTLNEQFVLNIVHKNSSERFVDCGSIRQSREDNFSFRDGFFDGIGGD